MLNQTKACVTVTLFADDRFYFSGSEHLKSSSSFPMEMHLGSAAFKFKNLKNSFLKYAVIIGGNSYMPKHEKVQNTGKNGAVKGGGG